MHKDILVVSHERSGTHFAINSIAFNLGLDPNPINFPILHEGKHASAEYKKLLEEFVSSVQPSEKRKIYKSHHDARFFRGCWEELESKFDIVYVYRAALDVMTSMFYYFNSAPHAFPTSESPYDLAYKRPHEYKFDYAYSYEKYDNFLDRWNSHLDSWKKLDVSWIRYANLLNDRQETMDRLFLDLGEGILESYVGVPMSAPSVSPRKGVVGDWVKHFSEEQAKEIHEYIKQYNSSK